MKRALIILIFVVIATANPIDGLAEKTVKSPKLSSYDLALVELDQPLTLTGDDGKTATYERAYLIRLHGEFPTHGASVMRLYFGNEAIPEYGGLPGGLYFMIYEKNRLKAFAGKPIRYQIDCGPINEFEVRFDVRRFQPLKLMKLKDALIR